MQHELREPLGHVFLARGLGHVTSSRDKPREQPMPALTYSRSAKGLGLRS
jgi:hypothetical protein